MRWRDTSIAWAYWAVFVWALLALNIVRQIGGLQ